MHLKRGLDDHAMHDIRRIREDGAAFDAGLAKRGIAPVAATVLARDAEWRRVTTELQQAQQRRNEASKLIGQAKRSGDPADALMAEVADLKDRMARLEDDERRLAAEVEELLAGVPNLPADGVPIGADEAANVELRRVGVPKPRNFVARDHVVARVEEPEDPVYGGHALGEGHGRDRRALQRRERAWDDGHTGYSVVDGQIGEAVLHPTGETHG